MTLRTDGPAGQDGAKASNLTTVNSQSSASSPDPQASLVTFGRHRDKSVFEVVLKHPDYVAWLLSRPTLYGPAQKLRTQIECLIEDFDDKPFTAKCAGRSCSNSATYGMAYVGCSGLSFWCDNCDPHQLGAAPGRLYSIWSYENALKFVEWHCAGRRQDYEEIIKQLARAKSSYRCWLGGS